MAKFDAKAIKRIVRATKQLERSPINGPPPSMGLYKQPWQVGRVGKTASAISGAADGAGSITPGLGSVSFYDWDDQSGTFMLGDSVGVKSIVGQTIPAGRRVVCVLCDLQWVVVAADCPAV